MNDNRLDEDTLYEVMDKLESSFEDIQRTLNPPQSDETTLMLHDTTSTCFEGVNADNAEYGFSKDKRFDRYQIIVAVVCHQNGRPLAVKLCPGSKTDVETVQTQIGPLRERKALGQSGSWGYDPYELFDVSTFLCEGGGSVFHKGDSFEAGRALMQAIARYCAEA